MGLSHSATIAFAGWLAGALAGSLAVTSPLRAEDALPPASTIEVDYAGQILPLFEQHCLDCHGPDTQESNFRVDLRQNLLDGGDSGEPAVVLGNSGLSHLVRIVAGAEPSLVMPPDGDSLTAEEIGLLRAWIDQGMPMPGDEAHAAEIEGTDHWSLRPITRPPVPSLDDAAGRAFVANPIDAFVLRRLSESGLKPSPPADRRTLIRRVYLDMLGLLPTPEEVESFECDSRPDAYSRLVDSVLASPHFGERWARHWLDVVRFAESDGFETNHERPNAYHYRDYVVRAFNSDKPFDRFVLEQLAGDAVGADTATGFIVGGAKDLVASPDPVLTAMQRQDEWADMINTTGTAFLGLTIGCARCHNHKFDPISQVDYYAMQAVFAGVQHGERPIITPAVDRDPGEVVRLDDQLAAIENQIHNLLTSPAGSSDEDAAHAAPRIRPSVSAEHNEERFEPRLATRVRFTVGETNSGSEPCLDELEVWSVAREGQPPRNVALESAGAIARSSSNYPPSDKHRLEHIHDGLYGNDRSWISGEAGAGWVEVQWPEPVLVDRITWGRDRQRQYTDRLPIQYHVELTHDDERWQRVASSDDRLPPDADADALERRLARFPADQAEAIRQLVSRRDQLRQRRSDLLAQPTAYAGRFESPPPTHRLYRGDPTAPREQVAPDTVHVLGSLDLPLDAPEVERRRALAESIVAPDNPLTARVIANRLWHYHFGRGLVATPSDFGAMGAPPSHPELLDWLAAELRDGEWSLKHLHRLILMSATYQQSSRPNAAGLAQDADSVMLWRFPPRRLEAEAIRDNILLVSGALDRRMEGPGFLVFHPNDNYARNWVAKDEFGPPEFRRMLYATKLRMEHDAVFGAFDCPDGGQVAPQRTESTTPIQSLNLFNSDFVIDQSERFAARVCLSAGEDPSRQVKEAFRMALGRSPEPDEHAAAVRLVEDHGLAALCRAIYNANAFLYLR